MYSVTLYAIDCTYANTESRSDVLFLGKEVKRKYWLKSPQRFELPLDNDFMNEWILSPDSLSINP